MSIQKQGGEVEDAQVEVALRHFRASVHAWSEEEFARARTVKPMRWRGTLRIVTNPVTAWALAAVLVVTGVAVPVSVHHERQVAAQLAAQQAARLAEEAKLQKNEMATARAMNDEELLSHVDSDISQAAPDAMEPLASLMSDSGTN